MMSIEFHSKFLAFLTSVIIPLKHFLSPLLVLIIELPFVRCRVAFIKRMFRSLLEKVVAYPALGLGSHGYAAFECCTLFWVIPLGFGSLSGSFSEKWKAFSFNSFLGSNWIAFCIFHGKGSAFSILKVVLSAFCRTVCGGMAAFHTGVILTKFYREKLSARFAIFGYKCSSPLGVIATS